MTRPLYAATEHLDGPTRMQYVDLFTWLRGDILVKADKMTMANSLELRVPFLDTEVFRVASSVPTDRKLTRAPRSTRCAGHFADIVPPHVLNRDKLGFPVPIKFWLKDVMYDWARDDHRRVAGRRPDRSGRGTAHASRAPHRPARLLAQDLDALVLHALARHLRREAHPAEHPEPVYPVRL